MSLVSDLLWRDTAIFEQRYAKCAAILSAFDRVLRRSRPLAAEQDEFHRLEARLFDVGGSAFHAVWRDPYTYFWTRIAYELLGSMRRGGPPPGLAGAYCRERRLTDSTQALALHLGDFKRLVLGACVLARENCSFDTPLPVRLPMAIPGTALNLEGTGSVDIAGVEDGALRIEAPDGPLRVRLEASAHGGGVRVEVAPAIGLDGGALKMQPQAYHVPGLGIGEIVAAAGIDYQARHRPLITSAIDLMREHQPHTYQQFCRLIRLIALKPRTPHLLRRDNVSHSDFPGAMVVNPTHNPAYLADVLIHEMHHNRLFFIEEIEPLFSGADTALASAPRYYSPWQHDARPLHAIFHALYVFIAVSRFWLALHARGRSDPATAEMVVDRILRGRLQVRIAAHQLHRHARFTEFGRTLFDEMRADLARMDAAIDAAGLPEDTPAIDCADDGTISRWQTSGGGCVSARQAVAEHLHASSIQDQARDILAHVRI